MATFLQIAQLAASETGVSSTEPVSVTGNTGMLKRIVDWTALSWIEIQTKRSDWRFMRLGFSFNTVNGQRYYTPTDAGVLASFAFWREDTLRCYATAAGVADRQDIEPWEWDEFRDTFLLNADVLGRPTQFSVRPNDLAIALDNVPNATGYTIDGDYVRKPQILANSTDVPIMPDQFHGLIAYRAMMKYAFFNSAPEIMAAAKAGWGELYPALIRQQVPPLRMAKPLA